MAGYDSGKKDLTMVPDPERESGRDTTSPYLEFQDKNGNGIPDNCDDVTEPVKVCKNCIPNPYSIVSNWRELESGIPRLNEKNCTYEVSLVTPRTTTDYEPGMTETEAAEAFHKIWEHHAPGAIQQMLEELQKDDSQDSIDAILKVVQYSQFHMEPRVGSRLKLLYVVDYDSIFNLPDMKDETDVDEEEPIDKSDIKVTLNADQMNVTAIKLRKGLNLYNRYLKVFRATEGGNLKFKSDDRIFNLGDYGDDGMFGSSTTENVFDDLDSWLDARGYTLNVSFWDFFSTDTMVSKLECVFTYDYKIKKMKVFTQGCLDRPRKTYGKARLASLRRRSSWKDMTAVAYFAQQNDMVRDLESRQPKQWLEYLVEYTVPEVYVYKPEGPLGKPSISDCVAANLENEFKELGQDIFDDVFSLGDAIAKAFHDKNCRTNPDEVDKDMSEAGLNPAATFSDLFNMQTMADFQAFFTVDEKDPIFVNMCKKALVGPSFGSFLGGCGGGPRLAELDRLYRHGLGPLKSCGLFDLLIEALECLFKGLTLAEALGRILLAGLKAMGVEDFGVLFVGLPADKRRELDALVKKNLSSGKSFGSLNDDPSPRTEDAPFFGGFTIQKPWENEEFVAHQKAIGRPGPFGSTSTAGGGSSIVGYDPTQEQRTLSDMLAGPSDQQKGELDPNVVLEAYLLGLIEVYEDNYLALLDVMSSFPGAQLISGVIALLDCPTPPLFNPGIDDFIKSIGLPFCRNPMDLVAIRFENPFRAWPKLSDILGLLFKLLKCILVIILMKVLLAIVGKICEIIGNAICKALETVGAVAGSLPGILSGRESMYEVIRETICGDGASNQQIEDTVVSLVADLGAGGAALADPEKAISFFADSMNAMTREEVFEGFTQGALSSTALEMVDNLIEFDYPEYREAFPTKASINSFYKNVGNLIPAETTNQLNNILDAFPEDRSMPANPSMCSTPEELELFDELRCSILENRMSSEQCAAQNQNAKIQLLEDLDDIANVLNQGVSNIVEANMPPVFSDPGCDNGLLPYQPDEIQEVAMISLDSDMKKMEATFATDMLGDGGFFSSQKDWGFLNMVLSDTYGNPWTVHQDKTANGAEWVSYYGEMSDEEPFGPPSPPASPWKIPLWIVEFIAWIVLFPLLAIIYLIDLLFFGSRRGAYPLYVAGWLREQFNPNVTTFDDTIIGLAKDLRGAAMNSRGRQEGTSMQFIPTQDRRRERTFYKSFDSLGFDGFLWDPDVELVDVPSYGYNVTAKPQFGNDRVKFTKEARKDTPDIKLTFRDNAKGYRSGPNNEGSPWAYGFQVNAYYHDLYRDKEARGPGYKNRPDDNVRVSVTTALNFGAYAGMDTSTLSESDKNKLDSKEGEYDEDHAIMGMQRMEWLSTDDSLSEIPLNNFPELRRHFVGYVPYSPPISALLDLTRGEMGFDEAADMYREVNQTFFNDMAAEIYDDTDTEGMAGARAWKFGATMETLLRKDFDYGVTLDPELWNAGYTADGVGEPSDDPETWAFVPYWDLQFNGESVMFSDDPIMGISRDMHNANTRGNPDQARVFYLNPGKYGGNSIFPPVYAKPQPNTGWTGMVDIMFPERSPCNPKPEGIAGFGEVMEMVRKTYASISEDKRLAGSPDCTKELPFDRMLTRSGKTAIRGLIMAGIRGFANVSLIKALPVFSAFAPRFPQNYSNLFAGYIIEVMKEEMMTTGGNWLNPFNDNEFWYAFLEMCVQFYVERLGDDEDKYITVENMPEPVRKALEDIDKMQKNYKYPWDFDDFNSEDYGTFESMKSFRESKNLEAVQRMESQAKIVMQELVVEQLSAVGELFNKAYERAGVSPRNYNMNFWFYNNYCAGGEGLSLKGKHISRPVAGLLATEGGNHYTTGNMLALPSGIPYVGEYHVHRDVDGYNIFMAGAEHSEEEKHDRLIPFANILEVVSLDRDGNEVLLGDIPSSTTGGDKKFYLKKFVDVNGSRMSNSEAKYLIRGMGGNISDHYPGTIKLIHEKIIKDGVVVGEGKAIGVEGELAVRYGLEIGINANGGPIPIARTHVAAVDTPCDQFRGVEANSKLLLCLIEQLETEPNYRLMVDYIFSMKKTSALFAVYVDLGLLPSIGEWTVPTGALKSPSWPESIIPLEPPGDGGKPGGHFRRRFIWKLGDEILNEEDPDGNYIPMANPWGNGQVKAEDREDYKEAVIAQVVPDPYFIPGWLSEDDRNGWFTSFGFLDFDEWDQGILRNMTRYMKNSFKTHYRNRKFGLDSRPDRDPFDEWLNGIVEKFRYNPAYQILPWFQKKQARGNPFNANGEECSRKNSG